ncbi:MAG: Ig-like domain-containing protein [Planctomycetes bacterium]|nr:Ig-like domain-containing protein [Planctomycetota bacterium]
MNRRINRVAITRFGIAAGAALVVVGAAAVGAAVGASDAQARTRGGNEDSNLVVTLVTPTTNQEVLPDLSDPGLNSVVTVRFSAPIRPGDFIANNNVFNRLTPAVEFLSSTFDRLPGTPLVQSNVFRFDPRTPTNGGVLPNGQYTLNIKKSVRSTKGRLLNQGLKDFTTTFSVGTDQYPPVLRTISPIQNQQSIGLNQKIIVTFNEPVNPASLITTITVTDVSTNPPTPILGVQGGTGITTDRGGFDVVFTPDPCFGYPPKSTIQFQMQGRPIADPTLPATNPCAAPPTSGSAVTDAFNNQFRRDAGLQWAKNAATNLWESPNGTYEDCTGLFKMQFVTRGIVSPPVGMVPGSSQFFAALCPSATVYSNGSCAFQGRCFFYTTGTSLGEIDITAIVTLFNSQGVADFTRAKVVTNSPVRMGRPGGMMVDPRWDANTTPRNHTFIYMVDQRSATVQILDSRNLKVLGRLAGFSNPRDIGMSSDFGANRLTLWVSDFAAKQVVAIDLTSIAVNLGGQPGSKSPCDAIKDNTKSRVTIAVGSGPSDIAGDSYLLNRALVVNSLDNSVTLLDAARNKKLKDYAVGGNPVSCDWTFYGFGSIDAAAVANQGGLSDPSGSVSLYARVPVLQNLLQAQGQTRDDIEATLTDGIKNPTFLWANQEWANPMTGNSIPQAYLVPNTGGKTIVDLRLSITGVFGLLIDLQANQTREVGFNPTGIMFDAYYPNQMLFACVAGEGQFSGMDAVRTIAPQSITVPGIRRIFTCYSH